jgi:hypothetical protein
MKIVIKSIEAEIINKSTVEENEFLISRWVVTYEIIIEHDHVLQGRLNWYATPNTYKIMKFINWFYDKRNTNTPLPA